MIKEFKDLKGRFLKDSPLSRHTTMRVGGRAPLVFLPETLDDAVRAVKLCKNKGISLLAIGGGSNIIVSDSGTKKFIMKLSSPAFTDVKISGERMVCGAGAGLAGICRAAEENGLGGCEFLAGIPGTFGGAVVQNAGAHGSSVSDILEEAECIAVDGSLVRLKRSEIGYGYRKGGLEAYIVTAGTVRLKKCAKAAIKKRTAVFIEKRLNTQDYTAPSAGCIFKNPEDSDMSAGEMIDRCGLKGRMIGGACVSTKHANFIINKKRASAEDILSLIDLIKKKVSKEYGVELSEEVKIIE